MQPQPHTKLILFLEVQLHANQQSPDSSKSKAKAAFREVYSQQACWVINNNSDYLLGMVIRRGARLEAGIRRSSWDKQIEFGLVASSPAGFVYSRRYSNKFDGQLLDDMPIFYIIYNKRLFN